MHLFHPSHRSRIIGPARSWLAAIALALLLALPLLAPPVAFAQKNPNNWVDGGYAEEMYSARTTGSVSQSPYTVRSFDTPMYRTIEHILGPVPGITVTADVWQRNPTYAQQMLQKSAVAGIGNYIAMMYANPPADLALWIQDTGQTLGFLPKQAYAQGVGFSGLAPLLPIWKAFRNIAYLLLAIVMIVIGFMVMLRKKIDPKTVVTVQNALPRIVITLLLITFSYAIVGILIDVMYLVLFLVAALLVSASNGALGPDTATKYVTADFGRTVVAMFGGGFRSLDDLIRFLNPGSVITDFSQLASFQLLPFIAGVATGVIETPFLILLLGLALLFMVIRIFLMLLTAYIQIIVALLIGPLQLLLEAFPGGVGFTSWITNLISNIIVFPVTAALILIGTILTQTSTINTWTPPLLGTGGQGVSAIIGLGILMVIPTVVNGIKESLKAKSAIPASPGAIMAPIGGAFQTIMGTTSSFYYGGAIVGKIAEWSKGGKPKKE